MDRSRKALVVTTVGSTIDQFCMNDINILKQTHKVYVAANFSRGNNTSEARIKEFKLELQKKKISINEMDFSRNPLSLSNLIAYRSIKKLINENSFDIIHCHTPIAAMLVRLAARRARKRGTKVLYTAHGFHFYNGAPLKNWLLYYPIERSLAKYTDVLITINKEDFARAKKSFKAGRIKYIPGVGIDTKKFSEVTVDKSEKRKELGVPDDAFVILSVGELNKNKNHEVIIKALAKIDNPTIYYLICGQGVLESYLKALIKKLALENQVKLLGFREDIAVICKISDVFAFPSKREGLPVALMEAMAVGLPIVCSAIRGNTDLVKDGKNGYLIDSNDDYGISDAIIKIKNDNEIKSIFGNNNIEITKRISLENVKKEMKKIYGQV